MNENDELKKAFEEAKDEDYLDKKTICAGLGIKLSLLNSKAIHGGGPPHVKESNKLFYRKGEAIMWHAEYCCAFKRKRENLRVAIFSMANQNRNV